MTIQYGYGEAPQVHDAGLKVDSFPLKASGFDRDIADADLIIGHAGAGTILEALRAGKKIVVVVNDKLMNNHQLEIADAMAARRYLAMLPSPNQISLLRTMDL